MSISFLSSAFVVPIKNDSSLIIPKKTKSHQKSERVSFLLSNVADGTKNLNQVPTQCFAAFAWCVSSVNYIMVNTPIDSKSDGNYWKVQYCRTSLSYRSPTCDFTKNNRKKTVRIYILLFVDFKCRSVTHSFTLSLRSKQKLSIGFPNIFVLLSSR